jgi:hypothetical protein
MASNDSSSPPKMRTPHAPLPTPTTLAGISHYTNRPARDDCSPLRSRPRPLCPFFSRAFPQTNPRRPMQSFHARTLPSFLPSFLIEIKRHVPNARHGCCRGQSSSLDRAVVVVESCCQPRPPVVGCVCGRGGVRRGQSQLASTSLGGLLGSSSRTFLHEHDARTRPHPPRRLASRPPPQLAPFDCCGCE